MGRKKRAPRSVSGVFLFLTSAFRSLSLAYTATSPPFRHRPKASAALGPTAHPGSPRQTVVLSPQDKLH